MKYLRSANVLDRINAASSVAVFLDFDGTLVPIAPKPDLIRVPKAAPSVLRTLAKQKKYAVGVITGRSLADLRKYIRITPDILFAGNHGLEWVIRGKYSMVDFPQGYITALTLLNKRLKSFARSGGKADVEWKQTSISVHITNRTPHLRRETKTDIIRIINQENPKNLFEIIAGKRDIDIRPNMSWTKAEVIRHFLDELSIDLRSTVFVYIGDDKTDEDVFRAFSRSVTVHVGRSKTSDAKYYLRNPGDVLDFLKELNNDP